MPRSSAGLEVSRRASRDAKRRRKGSCVDCGATTHYAGKGPTTISQRCPRCANAHVARAKHGTGSVNSKVLVMLAKGPATFTEIRLHLGKNKNDMGALLGRLMRYGLIVRIDRGVYALPPKERE